MATIEPPTRQASSMPPLLQSAAIDPAICLLPLIQHRVPAVFPSPTDEYDEKVLDRSKYLSGAK